MSILHSTATTDISLSGLRITIVCARFNEIVTGALLKGAVQTLTDSGLSDDSIEVVWVPGAFELPLAARVAAERHHTSAVICLGAVIRGDTPHFEYVSSAAANGILSVGLTTNKPVIFGVLTTDSPEQAFDRAGGRVGNKGSEAALAALEMLKSLSLLRENTPS